MTDFTETLNLIFTASMKSALNQSSIKKHPEIILLGDDCPSVLATRNGPATKKTEDRRALDEPRLDRAERLVP